MNWLIDENYPKCLGPLQLSWVTLHLELGGGLADEQIREVRGLMYVLVAFCYQGCQLGSALSCFIQGEEPMRPTSAELELFGVVANEGYTCLCQLRWNPEEQRADVPFYAGF